MERAMESDDRARITGSYCEAPALGQVGRPKASIIRNDVVDELIVVVNGERFAGLNVDGVRHEGIILHQPFWHRAVPFAKKQVGSEDVIVLSVHMPAVRRNRRAASV